LLKSALALIKCLSLFLHFALLFLNQTLTLGSVRLVHMEISSLVDMSGYLFRVKRASSS